MCNVLIALQSRRLWPRRSHFLIFIEVRRIDQGHNGVLWRGLYDCKEGDACIHLLRHLCLGLLAPDQGFVHDGSVTGGYYRLNTAKPRYKHKFTGDMRVIIKPCHVSDELTMHGVRVYEKRATVSGDMICAIAKSSPHRRSFSSLITQTRRADGVLATVLAFGLPRQLVVPTGDLLHALIDNVQPYVSAGSVSSPRGICPSKPRAS